CGSNRKPSACGLNGALAATTTRFRWNAIASADGGRSNILAEPYPFGAGDPTPIASAARSFTRGFGGARAILVMRRNRASAALVNQKAAPAARRRKARQESLLDHWADVAPSADRHRPKGARAQPRRNFQRGEYADRARKNRPSNAEREEQQFELDRLAGCTLRCSAGDGADAFVGED